MGLGMGLEVVDAQGYTKLLVERYSQIIINML